MGLKVWLDDVRRPPVDDGPWVWAMTAEDAVEILDCCNVDAISLDHDLGPGRNGQWVAQYIAEMQQPPEVRIHSMNPVGAAAMRAILNGGR